MNDQSYNPESLANRLDEVLPPESSQNIAATDADPLVQVAGRLASMPVPALSPEAVARIKAQLPPVQPVPRVLRWRGVATSLATVAAATVLIFVTGRLSLESIPGDVLYPVKNVVEQGEVAFAANPASRAEVYLQHAQRRADEFQQLNDRGTVSPELLASAEANTASAVEIAVNLDPASREAILDRSNQVVAFIASISETEEPEAVAVVPTATPTVIQQLEVTSTPLPPTVTDVPTVTIAPSATEQEINIVIEGEIEEIREDVIIIHGIEIYISPDDPLRKELRKGDHIRVEGNIQERKQILTIDTVDFEFLDETVEVDPSGEQVWRDEGNCNNPPPPWANANGWRARCQPGNTNNQNNGNNNNGNNNGRGNNGNRGNGKGSN